MLAVYSAEEELGARIDRCLDGSRTPRITGTWDDFADLLADADAGVVADPEPEPELFGRIQSCRELHPGTPLLLVTRRKSGTLRRLKDVRLEEVVWTGELEEELRPSLERAEAERRFREIEERLAGATHLSPTLRTALQRAVRRRPPLISVADLAAEVGRDRRTLWHHWSGAYPEPSELTPKGFLDWVLLLRAIVARSGDESWGRVAGELGVHTRTLRRMADRRLGISLAEVAGMDRERFFERFREEILVPLDAAGEGDDGEEDEESPGLRTA